jgi:enoyl-CoA hydratase/carnithine racemase
MAPAYFDKYPCLAMKRDEAGILEMRLHSDGGPFRFSAMARSLLVDAFFEVSRDRGNKVIILTGTGDAWCAELDRRPEVSPDPLLNLAGVWDLGFGEGRRLMQNMLEVDVPMIAAVNGPALVHSEHILTCDIILASETAAFQDQPHLNNNVSPSDGVHVLWPAVLGPARGRYFLLTQQRLSAQEALALGVCQEVLPPDQLLERAYAIARKLCEQPAITLRCARVALTHRLKRLVADDMTVGLALESVSALSKTFTGVGR